MALEQCRAIYNVEWQALTFVKADIVVTATATTI